MLDLEAQSVDADYFNRIERGLGAHQHAISSLGVNDRHEAHETPCWTPQEISRPVARRPFGLAVDDAGTDLHGVDVSQQGFQQHLGAIQL